MDATTVIILLAAGGAVILLVFLSQVKGLRSLNLRDAAEAFEQGEFYKAKNILSKLLEEDPGNHIILWYLARARKQLDEVDDAISSLERFIQLAKFESIIEDLPALGELSELEAHKMLRELLKQTKNEQALFSENQILMRLDDTNPEYPLELAMGLARKQEYSERTVKFLARVLELDSNNLDAINLLALIYFRGGNINKAHDFAKRALELNPNLVETKYILAEVMLSQGQTDEAKELLNQAVNSVYFGKSAMYTLGKLYSQSGDFEEALEWLTRADKQGISAQEPSSLEWDVKYQLANVYEKLNDSKNALILYQDIEKFQKGYKDVGLKLKSIKVEKIEATDNLKDFQTAKNEIFAIMCEDLVKFFELEVDKLMLTNDGNANILAKTHDIEPQKVAIFIRRNLDVIQEDQPRLLVKFSETAKAAKTKLISTGAYADSAKTYCKRNQIEYFNGDQLTSILDKSLKLSY